jgi:hypothetical protein
MSYRPLPPVACVVLLLTTFAFIAQPASAQDRNIQQVKQGNSRPVLPKNKVPGQVESTTRRLVHRLDKDGYEVMRGYFKLYTTDDCDVSYDVMHTCFGNNPAAPYALPVVPPWPDDPGPGEWVDPATVGALGRTADGYNASYRLDPHEALVIIARMPPPAAYFGMKTYLFTRAGELCTESDQYDWIGSHVPALFPTFFSLVPNEPESAPRVQIIADLSNSTNNVVISDQSGSVWDQVRYFIITPNPTMDAAIRDAFTKLGIEDHDIFTEKIPEYFASESDPPNCPEAAALRFGLDQEADDFVTLIRYAMPEDGTAADRWRQRLPLVVLRIRNLAADELTYPWEDFEPRTPSDPPETAYSPDLDALTQAVCGVWNKEGTQDCSQWKPLLNLQADPLRLTGPDCVPAWMNCIAPNEDTTYQMSSKLPLDSDHFYAVAGALSTATGNAKYVGLGLNSSVRQLGFDNLSDDELTGSATGYSSAVPSDKFFVQYFARDCSGLAERLPAGVSFRCHSIGDTLPYCYDTSDLQCDMLVLSLRGYIRPGTQRATDKDSVLISRLIRLNRPNP